MPREWPSGTPYCLPWGIPARPPALPPGDPTQWSPLLPVPSVLYFTCAKYIYDTHPEQ